MSGRMSRNKGKAGERESVLDRGTWYQSAVSGLWYQDEKAAGTISKIRVDGKSKPITEGQGE